MSKRLNKAKAARLNGIPDGVIYYRTNQKGMNLDEAVAMGGARCWGIKDDRYRFAYPALREYLLNKGLSIKEFARQCALSNHTMHDLLFGMAVPSKTTIDKVLAETGMTYEECFKEA